MKSQEAVSMKDPRQVQVHRRFKQVHRRFKKRLIPVGAIALAFISASSLSVVGVGVSPASGASSTPIVLGAISSESGVYGPYGIGIVKGMQVAVNIQNAKGGVLGHQLKLDIIDDASNSSTAATAVQSLLSSSNLPLEVNCGATPTDCGPILTATSRAHVITFADSGDLALYNTKLNPYNFLDIPALPQYQVAPSAGAVKLVSPHGPVAIVTSTSPDGTAYASVFGPGFKTYGLKEPLSPIYVSLTATDLTPQLEAMKRAGIKVIFDFLLNSTQTITMMNNILTMGWTGVKVVGGVAAGNAVTLTAIPKAMSSRFSVLMFGPQTRPGPISSLSPYEQQFLTGLQKLGGSAYLENAEPGSDEVNLMIWAIEKAKSTNPAKVLYELNHLSSNVALPNDLFLPHPNWSPTNHALADANYSTYWSVSKGGQPVEGTYLGTTLHLPSPS